MNRKKIARINTTCDCPMARLSPGELVVINNQEVKQGIQIYCGESEHSTPYAHMVKVMPEETYKGSWHLPCKSVYQPFPDGVWPYKEYRGEVTGPGDHGDHGER